MMRALTFRDIAKFVNFTKTAQIKATPDKGKEERWGLYAGHHRFQTVSYPFSVLYLNAAAQVDDIKTALRETRDLDGKHIVYPLSLPQRTWNNPDITRLLNPKDHRWTAPQYLVSFIEREVRAYLNTIGERAPRDYVDPRIETPAGFAFSHPNPILSFLQDELPEDSAGQLGIVLAEPGQGKTYMTQHVASRLADPARGLIPLMVDSSQWNSMSPDDRRSLDKTIAHSFRHFGSPIGWIEGHEEEFLRLMLMADVLRIVFDGFDEYILRNDDSVQPLDVLESLAGLARSTGARIVLTSRTSFWETNYSSNEIISFLRQSGSSIFKMEPFRIEDAKNYFAKKLLPEQAARAVQIYMLLRETNEEFVGRGFVLNLIADVATDPNSTAVQEELSNPLRWLTKAICRREQTRQDLPLTADDQLGFLRIFAAEIAEQTTPSSELLEFCLQTVRSTLDAATLKSTMEKLRSHPLLEVDLATDRWKFKQEQIYIYFLAEQIIARGEEDLKRFLARARLLPELWQDLGTMIVQLVAKRDNWEEAFVRLQEVVKSTSSQFEKRARELPVVGDGSRLGGIISLMAVEKLLASGSTHAERAELLRKLSGTEAIRGLHFSGVVAKYDFSGVTFRNCRFDSVTWANCRFDKTTEFYGCQFVGGAPPRYSKGLGFAKFTHCHFDPEAEAIINNERVREGEKRYSKDELRSDMHSLLSRFVSKGGVGLKTLDASNLTKGTINNSPYRDDIVEMLENGVLEKHRISGGLWGYRIRKDADEAMKFYATNNVFTGPLREAYNRLRQKLHL